ncbi:DndE family protein [Candidatus Parabeggiatoa sp. HSG14]|uniref:DndE family protein n=1 Tax=Candidatus Parabeggiatoa sp. HSG14 TaxID=3055593 RepID=UPI0025A7F8E5|nr:DndE family protein [Thiotrichales bacterium HSG14]
MMADLSLTNVITAHFYTTQEADNLSKKMKSHLGFSTNYQMARLALGRSLQIKSFPDAPDSKSKPIEGHLLFGKEEELSLLWIGLIITHFKLYNQEVERGKKTEIDLVIFQELIRRHWHRGVILLNNDWKVAEHDYEKFIHILSTISH